MFTHFDADEITALAAIISALVTLIGGIGAALVLHSQTKRAVKKDEVDLLRSEVGRLSGRVDELMTENTYLIKRVERLSYENILLRAVLAQHGIPVPALDPTRPVPAVEAGNGSAPALGDANV